MGFQFYKENYTGKIKEITIGKGTKSVKVGGQSCYPFYQFEGDMPNRPKIAMEVWDMEPEDWPESALVHFKDVVSDPAAWAKKCVKNFGAELIVLQLKSIDPNGKNAGAEETAAVVKKVSEAVDVPLVVWGCANPQKDDEVFKRIAEVCQGKNLTIGPVEDKNHKGIGASAMAYGHTVISSSPIDVNLAKQINILLENLGVPKEKVIIDPTTGGLGYGLEYSYSVMERIRMAALNQGDDKLQFPIINNLGNEVWKCKEAKETAEAAPTLGDPEKRGILMEAIGAVSYLMAGSDILIMRHPEAIRMVKAFVELLINGGDISGVTGINKKLPTVDFDYASMAPKPNLTIEEEKGKKPEVVEKKAEPKAAAAPKPVPKKEEPKPKVTVVDEAKAKVSAEAEVKAKAEAEAKAKAEVETKAKAEAEARAKAAADKKARGDAEAKAKAEAEAKAKADAEAKAKAEAEAEIRLKRAKEREELTAQRAIAHKEKVAMTPAAQQLSMTDKMIDRLNRIHRRVA
ncbi:MAG: acetyl-CoA synthase [Deltaproteobacteria bacterium RBG_13_49_15]|nr:MAG: acetyl-CoA synthase [Deltaproteobacteria bacterium RBG_13_49_15]